MRGDIFVAPGWIEWGASKRKPRPKGRGFLIFRFYWAFGALAGGEGLFAGG
jgi:hypothetical protein